jgi:hypothetical protein
VSRPAEYGGRGSSEAGADFAARASYLTKIVASQSYRFVAEQNIQVHGGMEFTWARRAPVLPARPVVGPLPGFAGGLQAPARDRARHLTWPRFGARAVRAHAIALSGTLVRAVSGSECTAV